MTEEHGAAVRPPETKEIAQLLLKASKGDQHVIPALRKALEAHPWCWQELGDLARTTRQAVIQRAAGAKNLGQQEIYTRKLDAMTQELAGAVPSPVERLLVERIVLCWAHLHYVEALYLQQMHELTLRQATFYQQRISHAQARYLSAIRTLAQIRRLGVPAVQVNIAEQQVITG